MSAPPFREGRRVHFLAPYRAEHSEKLGSLLGLHHSVARDYRSNRSTAVIA